MSEKTSIAIPREFWGTMSPNDFEGIVHRGGLDRGQCIRLWEMLGLKDQPPPALGLFVDRGDLERLVARMKRAPEGAPDMARSRPKES